jgi:hypothetical protein
MGSLGGRCIALAGSRRDWSSMQRPSGDEEFLMTAPAPTSLCSAAAALDAVEVVKEPLALRTFASRR